MPVWGWETDDINSLKPDVKQTQNSIAIFIAGMGRYLQYHITKTEKRRKTDEQYCCNC